MMMKITGLLSRYPWSGYWSELGSGPCSVSECGAWLSSWSLPGTWSRSASGLWSRSKSKFWTCSKSQYWSLKEHKLKC